MRADLQGQTPSDQTPQEDHEREVKAAEADRVKPGECQEQKRAQHNQPNLISPPEMADRRPHRGPLPIVSPEQRKQDTNPQIETVRGRVRGGGQGNNDKPDRFHGFMIYPSLLGLGGACAYSGTSTPGCGPRPSRPNMSTT